ncbi:MAG: hypothetical protein JNK81_08160 [Anaerolineales bacterium]|nr:hypothetical protein [Anaerolineales bacterium]
MFEGLDDIDWKNVGYHIWGNSDDYLEEIPQRIKELNSPDQEIRGHAIEHVLGENGTFGAICDTTPYIVPFIIKLLSDPTTIERITFFDYLSRVMDNVLTTDNLSIDNMRLHIQVYDSISEKRDILMKLLHDSDQGIQIFTISILGELTGDAEVLLSDLFRFFKTVQNEDVKIVVLKSIKRLLSSLDQWKQRETKEKYALILRDIVNESVSLKIQVAAAQASVETFMLHRKDKMIISEKVVDLLSQEFIQYRFIPNFGKLYWIGRLNYSMSFIRALSRIGHEPLLMLLKNPELDVIQTQIVVRGLFASFLLRFDEQFYWISNLSHTEDGLFYLPKERTGDYRVFVRNKDNAKFFKQVLQTVAENEKFWQMPTNMFSFFFGLPNSRQEIQEILNNL